MKIGRCDKFWIVTEPTPVSALRDVCFEASLQDLELQIKGGLTCEEGLTLFTDHEEAEVEARTRLLARDTARALATGAQALEGAATVQIVGKDGEVVFSAPIPGVRRCARTRRRGPLMSPRRSSRASTPSGGPAS